MIVLLLQVIHLFGWIQFSVMPRDFLKFTPVFVVILTFTLSLCGLILYRENKGGYRALYPTFLSESSVLLTLTASLSSYKVCLIFLLLVNIDAYLLFLHSLKLSFYSQNLLYFTYVEDLLCTFFIISKASFTQLKGLCSFIAQ